MQLRFPNRVAYCALCCLFCLSPTASSGAFGLVRQPSTAEGRPVLLSNGYSVLAPQGAFTDLVIRKGRQSVARLPLRKQMEVWLRARTAWPDADTFNSMLYMEMQGAHFLPILQDVTPFADGALAILDWQDQAGSGTPVKAQHLVRIQTLPHPGVTLLRPLPMGQEVQYALPPPRLFFDGKRLLLFTAGGYGPNAKSRLQIIAPDGKVVASLTTFPGNWFPTAFEKERLLQLRDDTQGNAQPFWTYDVRTKQLRHRPEHVAIVKPEETPKPPDTPKEHLRQAIQDNDVDKVRTLLAQGAPADVEALIQACWRPEVNMEILRLLLDKGAPVNGKSQYGETPLLASLNDARPDMQETCLLKLALLIERGADVKSATGGETLLDRVVQRHLDKVARFLLQHGAEPAPTGAAKITPLHVAALVNDEARVQTLLKTGASINAADSAGETPLFMAVVANAAQSAQTLLNAGADPNTFRLDNGFRHTALSEALQRNAPDVALLLVTHGADVNMPGPYGDPPLILALHMWDSARGAMQNFQSRKDALIEMLLQRGAKINAADRSSFTPLAAALHELRNANGSRWFKELLERGADPNARFADGRTVLFLTVDPRRAELDIPLLLLAHGADLNVANAEGITPLMEAVSGQDFALARLLLEWGARPEGHDRVHKTPLLWAAYYGQVDLLKLLLAKGAKLGDKDDLGQNALVLARKGKQQAAISFLQQQGLRSE